MLVLPIALRVTQARALLWRSWSPRAKIGVRAHHRALVRAGPRDAIVWGQGAAPVRQGAANSINAGTRRSCDEAHGGVRSGMEGVEVACE
jgi:hypothetical protein